jgi:hypothetical protein
MIVGERLVEEELMERVRVYDGDRLLLQDLSWENIEDLRKRLWSLLVE